MRRRDPQNDVSTTAIPEVSLVFDGSQIIEITLYSTSTITVSTDASTTPSDTLASTTSTSSTSPTATSTPSPISSTLATSTTPSTTSSISSTSTTDPAAASTSPAITSTLSGQSTTTSLTSSSTANPTSVPLSGNGVSGRHRFTDADAAAVAGAVIAAAVLALLLALLIAMLRSRRRSFYRRSGPHTKLVPTASEVDSWRRPSGNMVESVKPSHSRADRHLRISNMAGEEEAAGGGAGALGAAALLGAGAGAGAAAARRTPPPRPQHPDTETGLCGESSSDDHSLYNQSTSRVVFAGLPKESDSSGQEDKDLLQGKHDSGTVPDLPTKSIYRSSSASSSTEYLHRLGSYIDGDLPRADSVTPPPPPEERPQMHATLDSPVDNISHYYADEEEQDEVTPIMQPPASHARYTPAAQNAPVHYPNLSEFMEFDFAYGQSARTSHASSQPGYDRSWYRDSRGSS